MRASGVPWGENVTDRLGHHAPAMLIASIVGVVVLNFLPPPGLLAVTLPATLFAFVLLAFLLLRAHDRRLCERCVLAMPLNPAEKAARLRRRFWMAHTGAEPRFVLPYLAVLIGSNFTTTPVGRVGWALVQLSMIYLLLSYSTHRTLQPWCPWCSEGGGGSEVDETPPVLPRDDRLLT